MFSMEAFVYQPVRSYGVQAHIPPSLRRAHASVHPLAPPHWAIQRSVSAIDFGLCRLSFACALVVGCIASRRRRVTRATAVSVPAESLLSVRGLHAGIDGKEILRGINLDIGAGEMHVVMGSNGSGKSTLSRVLVGDPRYEVTAGEVSFSGQNLLALEPHERALDGLFLAFQAPPAVPGVSTLDFLRAALNARLKRQGKEVLDVIDFYGLATKALERLELPLDMLDRNVNDGFSGGERKKSEMLQMALLSPKLAILDEVDSGLDVDALKDVARDVMRSRHEDPQRSFLIVTHFERFLEYIHPDFVHVLRDGQIVASGDRSLAHKLDTHGYDWIPSDV